MAVSQRLRWEIFRRDENKCKGCGRTPEEDGVKLTVDHVVPVALGGGDEPSNLRTLCMDCNAGKSSVPADAPIVEQVSEDAARWAAAMQQVAQMRAAELDDQFALVDWFLEEWNNWTNWRDEPFDADDAPSSIPQFVKAGLTRQELRELIAVAMKSRVTDKWRYFCGCCWKRIRQNQEQAAQIVQQQEPAGPMVQHTISTRWTQEEVTEYQSGHVNLDCQEHEDGLCADDFLCRITTAARSREVEFSLSIYEWKESVRAERIADAIEDAELVYG